MPVERFSSFVVIVLPVIVASFVIIVLPVLVATLLSFVLPALVTALLVSIVILPVVVTALLAFILPVLVALLLPTFIIVVIVNLWFLVLSLALRLSLVLILSLRLLSGLLFLLPIILVLEIIVKILIIFEIFVVFVIFKILIELFIIIFKILIILFGLCYFWSRLSGRFVSWLLSSGRLRFLLRRSDSFSCSGSSCLFGSWNRLNSFLLFYLFGIFLFIFLIAWDALAGKEVSLFGLEKSSDVEGAAAFDNQGDLIEKRDEDIDCELGFIFGEGGDKELFCLLLNIEGGEA
jgi:hypothetical protein